MPTYQYVCTSCDEPHEAVQSFTDDALTDCPACDDGRLRKVFGSVGVVFKGSGFYRTDSRKSSSASESASSSSTSAGSGAGASSSGGSSTSAPASSSGSSSASGSSSTAGSSTASSAAAS